jgi:phosphatidylethanolamine/phosphatidyl-N-methylethanolamine N-methyltransferase
VSTPIAGTGSDTLGGRPPTTSSDAGSIASGVNRSLCYLPYLPDGSIAIATDLTPAMLAKARPRLRPGMHLAIMDGHRLAVRSASCDAVVLHLIVAVIPDPVRCLREVARVLRPGGRAIVFDKFTRGPKPPVPLRLLNVLMGALFTEVTRNFETILDQAGGLAVERDEPALFGGVFRRILLRKPA